MTLKFAYFFLKNKTKKKLKKLNYINSVINKKKLNADSFFV